MDQTIMQLSPYVRHAIDQTLSLPWRLAERIIFDYELVYIKSGQVRITIEDRVYDSQNGDIFFFRPGVPHSMTILSEEPLRQPHIHFDLVYRDDSQDVKISFRSREEMTPEELALVRPDITVGTSMELPERIQLNDTRVFEDMLFELIKEHEGQMPFSRINVRGMFLKLWTYLLREHYWQSNPGYFSQLPELFRIREYIQSNLDKSVTLDMLSQYSSISKYHLVRIFTRMFGISPIHYHHQARIEKAKKLIQFTQMPFADIAMQLGFDNLSSFSRAFKKMEGVAPSFYRSKNL